LASWQKRLRLVIALFVVVFAAMVVVSLKKGRPASAPVAAPKKLDEKAILQSGAGNYEYKTAGKVTFSIKFGNQFTYADNRSKFGGGVTVVLPDKNGRTVTIQSQDAELTRPPDKEVGTAVFTGGVKLTTSDGIAVTSATAAYNDDEKMTRIPGPLTFKKGRMTGTSVGGTYDQERAVLWLLDQAKVDVAADKKGNGAIHVTSKMAGMARNEHYMKFTGEARLEGDGQITVADDATAFLTEDDERLTRMELRGNSRITGKPGQSGPQDMSARDIDLAYAEDGRTLQSARLIENASVQLPGDKGKTGRRIAGKAIDITLAPDGSTVTNLVANEQVQVDLPSDGEMPARTIKSASLLATGPPGTGIQSATFSGEVEYRESRAARGKLAAIDRTARSMRLDIKTKPGFGDIEHAYFHNNVRFADGPHTTAVAPYAVYSIANDRLDLSPGEGNTGRGPDVSDGRLSITARNVQMMLATQGMKADTRVRTLMLAQSKQTKPGDAAVKVPSMMKQNEPVNVQSNRLDYDAAKSVATYDGNARLWQEDTEIRADKIVIEDKTGNLRATSKVVTSMKLSQAGDKTPKAAKKPDAEPTNTTADELLYEDSKHRATYTGNAHMSGPSGDVTADKIELHLAEQGGELERAEADGNVVSRQEARRAYGKHLTYLAKDDTYTMTGSPVKIFDQTPTNCRITEGATLSFHRTGNTTIASGNDTTGQTTKTAPVCPPEGTQ
jgi:lipopolysaccharide export system protein LptA